MWEYESDEDIGEDLGIAGEDTGNLDEVASGELEGGSGGAAKEAGKDEGSKDDAKKDDAKKDAGKK
jgi:hypothetical protein